MEKMDKGLTVHTKMVTHKLAKCTNTYLPKLSAQAQKFGILMKKGFVGRP